MTTDGAVPTIDTLVELTASGQPVKGLRVDEVKGSQLTLTAPQPVPPAMQPTVGETVMLRWPAGNRGRYALRCTVLQRAGNCLKVVVKVAGKPKIEQHRQYVRGGGGERIDLRLFESRNAQEFEGRVQDISEQAVRARFTGLRVRPGDPVWLRIQIEDQILEVAGSTLKAAPWGLRDIEVVALFTASEPQAQAIRRYVLHLQLLARTRTSGT